MTGPLELEAIFGPDSGSNPSPGPLRPKPSAGSSLESLFGPDPDPVVPIELGPPIFDHRLYGRPSPQMAPIDSVDDILAHLPIGTTREVGETAAEEYQLQTAEVLPEFLEDVVPYQDMAGSELVEQQTAERRNSIAQADMEARAQEFARLKEGNPKLSVPEFLEMELQGSLSENHDPTERLTSAIVDNPLSRGVLEGMESLQDLPGDLILRLQQLMGDQEAGNAADAKNRQQNIEGLRAGVQDDQSVLGGATAKAVRSAASSLTQSIPLAAAGGLPALVGAFSFDSANDSYTEAIDGGFSSANAAKYALAMGAIEGGITTAFSLVGAGGTEKILTQGAGKGMKSLLGNVVSELGEEESILFAQQYTRYMNGLAKNALPTEKEAFEIAYSTMLAVGASHGSSHAVQALSEKSDTPDHVRAMAEQVMEDLAAEQNVDTKELEKEEDSPDVETNKEQDQPDEPDDIEPEIPPEVMPPEGEVDSTPGDLLPNQPEGETSSEPLPDPVPVIKPFDGEASKPNTNGLGQRITSAEKKGLLDEDLSAGVRSLAKDDPEAAKGIFTEAERRAEEHNDSVRSFRQEWKEVFGEGAQDKMQKAKLGAAKGKDADGSLPGFDQTVQSLRDNPEMAPAVYAEAMSLGDGDLEYGLNQVLQGGQKQKGLKTTDDFVFDVAEEALLSFSTEPADSGSLFMAESQGSMFGEESKPPKKSIGKKKPIADNNEKTTQKTFVSGRGKDLEGQETLFDVDGVAETEGDSSPKALFREEPESPRNPDVSQFAEPHEDQEKTSVRQSRNKTVFNEGDDKKDPVSARNVLKTWERIFKVPLRVGGFSQRAAGIYKFLPQVVRADEKHASNLAVAAHEIAHHIDNMTKITGGVGEKSAPMIPKSMRRELSNLDYNPKKKRLFEGFAEYIRHYVTENDAGKQAKTFHKWFEETWLPKHPEWAQPLAEAKKLAREFGDQSVHQQLRSLIGTRDEDTSYSEQWKADAREAVSKLITNQVDQFHMLKKIQEMAREKGHKGKGVYDTTMHYTMTAAPNAEKSLEHGVHSLRTGELLGGPSLWSAKEFVNDRQEEEEAINFAQARFAVFMAKKQPGYNTGMDVEQAQIYLDKIQKQGKFERYEKFSKVIANYANSLLDMQVDAGAMTKSLRNKTVKKYGDNYFPLHRVQEGKEGMFTGSGFVNLPPALARRSKKGSGRKIIDPFDAMVARTVHDYNRAIFSRQMESLVRTVDPNRGGVEGMGGFMDQVDPKKKVHQGSIEEILDTLVEQGLVAEVDAKSMRIAAKYYRGEVLTEKEEDFIQKKGNPLWESGKIVPTEDILEKEPDILETISLWRLDFSPNAQKRTVLWHDRTGSPVLYEMEDALYKIATGADSREMHLFNKGLRATQKVFKAGAAGASTQFAGVNLLADFMTYQFRAKHVKGLRSLVDPWTALASYMHSKFSGKEKALVELFEELGGNIYNALGDDAARKRVRRKALTKDRKLSGENFSNPKEIIATSRKAIGKARNTASEGLSIMQSVVAWSDVAPRLAEMQAAIKEDGFTPEGKSWKHTDGTIVHALPEATRIKAGLAAANATINFKRGGTKAVVREAYAPFSRAIINSVYQHAGLIRNLKNIKNEGNEGDQARRYAVWFASLMASQAMYWFLIHDNDEYRESEQHDRKRFWYIPLGFTTLKIPKPRDEAIFLNAVENAFDSYFHPTDGASVPEGALDELFDRLPTGGGLIRGSVEAAAGWDYFRDRAITPDYMENRPVDLQFDNYTTEASKILSKYGGAALGLNPKEMDHLLNSATGGQYKRWADLYESAKSDISSGELKSLGARNVPFTGRLVQSRKPAKSVNDFYDAQDEAKKESYRDKQNGKTVSPNIERLNELNSYADVMKQVRDAEPDDFKGRRNYNYQNYLVGLSREALGRPPLKEYPSPFDTDDLPPEVSEAVSEFLAGKTKKAVRSLGRPQKAPKEGGTLDESIKAWESKVAAEEKWLEAHLDSKLVQQSIKDATSDIKLKPKHSRKLTRSEREAGMTQAEKRRQKARWTKWRDKAKKF